MTYVITQNCCNDAVCASVCPMDCISPTPDSADYAGAEMLYIDPDRCIDCDACAEVCPVDAIYHESKLPSDLKIFADINAEFFKHKAGQTS